MAITVTPTGAALGAEIGGADRGAGTCGVGGAAGRGVAPRDARRTHLVQYVAGRRRGAVGQPLHHAPARSVRCVEPADHAPYADEGRGTAGGVRGAPAV